MRSTSAVLLALVLCGCPEKPPPETTPSAGPVTTTPTATTSSSPPAPTTNAQAPLPPLAPTRYVGKKDPSAATCPAATAKSNGGQWNVRPMITRSPPPVALKDYCVYEWASNSGPPSSADVAGIPVSSAIPDEVIVVPHAAPRVAPRTQGSYLDAVTKDVVKKVRTQVGVANALPASPSTVDVAIPDSSPDATPTGPSIGPVTTGTYAHGYNIGMLVTRLASAGAIKANAPIMSLALPRINELSPPDPKGGYVGTESDLAKAIDESLEAWRKGKDKRLVVNLSLGWQCESVDKDKQPAFVALQHASCAGALIIVAAGNDQGAGDANATCPADWEKIAAPDDAACQKLEGSDYGLWQTKLGGLGSSNKGGASTPLVHSVGAVDLMDKATYNTRPHGMPKLAALGFQAVEFDDTAAVPADSMLLTGTSVSAAVASAGASLIWAYRPELGPSDVMQLLYDNGVDLKTNADYCLGSSCGSTHRIALASALAKACEGKPCASTFAKPVAAPPALDSDKNVSDEAYAILNPDAGAPSPKQRGNGPPDPCSHMTADQRKRHEHLVYPQPESVPCPACTWANSNNSLDGTIATDYSGVLTFPITCTQIFLSYSGGNKTYTNPGGSFSAGSNVAFDESHNPPGHTITSGTMTWEDVSGAASQRQSILIH